MGPRRSLFLPSSCTHGGGRAATRAWGTKRFESSDGVHTGSHAHSSFTYTPPQKPAAIGILSNMLIRHKYTRPTSLPMNATLSWSCVQLYSCVAGEIFVAAAFLWPGQ